LGDPLRGVIDLNFQVDWDKETPLRVLCYNTLLHREHRKPVHSIVIMLRSQGNDLRMDDGYRYSLFEQRGRLEFYPEVIRIWEQPLEEMLTGGLGLLPLATLAAMPGDLTREEALPEILKRIEQRLEREPSSEKLDRLLNWTYKLAGLHFTSEQASAMFWRSSTMWSDVLKKSATHQGTLQEGRVEGVQNMILRLGTKKFGPPDERAKNLLTGITNLDQLNQIGDSVLTANSWADLFPAE
jgi:hypothetical protein